MRQSCTVFRIFDCKIITLGSNSSSSTNDIAYLTYLKFIQSIWNAWHDEITQLVSYGEQDLIGLQKHQGLLGSCNVVVSSVFSICWLKTCSSLLRLFFARHCQFLFDSLNVSVIYFAIDRIQNLKYWKSVYMFVYGNYLVFVMRKVPSKQMNNCSLQIHNVCKTFTIILIRKLLWTSMDYISVSLCYIK